MNILVRNHQLKSKDESYKKGGGNFQKGKKQKEKGKNKGRKTGKKAYQFAKKTKKKYDPGAKKRAAREGAKNEK